MIMSWLRIAICGQIIAMNFQSNFCPSMTIPNTIKYTYCRNILTLLKSAYKISCMLLTMYFAFCILIQICFFVILIQPTFVGPFLLGRSSIISQLFFELQKCADRKSNILSIGIRHFMLPLFFKSHTKNVNHKYHQSSLYIVIYCIYKTDMSYNVLSCLMCSCLCLHWC